MLFSYDIYPKSCSQNLYFQGQKKSSLSESQAPIVTAKQFEIQIASQGKKKSQVTVLSDKVQFSTPLSPQYQLWQPDIGEVFSPPKQLWTKRYIGTDADFYQKGYRWGVSLGKTSEEFKNGPLFLPGGLINLPDGKYVIGMRANAVGLVEVVLGKEERGIDQRLIAALHQGELPKTNGKKEILGVANHSMLISRGQPYEAARSTPGDFSAFFAGEVGIEDGKITYVNDQSGQFFGPNGLLNPIQSNGQIPDTDKLMKQGDYEQMKSNALIFAKETLEKLTGHQNIHMVKVNFIPTVLPMDVLRQPRQVILKTSQVNKLSVYLKEKPIQTLVDQFEVEPEEQCRLLKVLAKKGEHRHAILDLTQAMVKRETLKPEQAAKLTLELLETPEAIVLFHPDSRHFVAEWSDNTKRKVIAAYNQLGLKETIPFSDFVQTLKRHYKILILFLSGRRMAGGYLKEAFSDLTNAAKGALSTLQLFKFGDKLDAAPGSAQYPLNEGTELIYRLENAQKQIKRLLKDLPKRPEHLKEKEVVLLTNPFEGNRHTSGKALHKNIRRLHALEAQGVLICRMTGTNHQQSLDFLTNLFAYAQAPKTIQSELLVMEMDALLKAYGVKSKSLYAFTMEKFWNRWTNDMIVAAYAQQNKGFRALLDDMVWFRDLPVTQLK